MSRLLVPVLLLTSASHGASAAVAPSIEPVAVELFTGSGAFSGKATVGSMVAAHGGHLVAFVQERDGGPVHGATALELP
ncbi:MAG TPA: hypothetical protein VF400_10235 [Anaeromyxobacteraceae bacterium]